MKYLRLFTAITIIAMLIAACGPLEVTYHFDLNYEGAPEINSITFTKGSTPLLPEEPVREGYYFNGWVYGSGNYVTEDEVGYLTMTLKAEWLELFYVSFIANGDEANPVAQEVKEGRTAEEPTEPAKVGYEFIGWVTTEDGDELFNFETPINEDITLYGKWTEEIAE